MLGNIEVIGGFKFEGLHRWPEAFESVSYLRERHRHTFTVRIGWKVTHEDRDIEFLHASDMVKKEYLGPLLNQSDVALLGTRSCETIAREIAVLAASHGYVTFVEVFEDNNMGARLT